MTLDIAEAIRNGFNRTIQKSGLMIIGLLFIIGVLNTILSHSIEAQLNTEAAAAATTLALPIPLAASALLMLLGTVASVIIGIVSIRTFVSDRTEHIPAEFAKRNILWTAGNIIAAGIAVTLVIGLAFAIPIIPGAVLVLIGLRPAIMLAGIGFLIGLIAAIYLAVRLILTNMYVAAEDKLFIDAIKDSWNTTDTHLLPLIGLGIIVVVISLTIGGLMSTLSILGIEPIGTVVAQIGSAIGGAFTTATLAQVYRQLRPETQEVDEEAENETTEHEEKLDEAHEDADKEIESEEAEDQRDDETEESQE